MRLSDFDYDLPEDRIALRPARPRDAARMLAVGVDGALTDGHVRDLPDWLQAGDLLVVNDTRVIPAALAARRPPRGDGPPVAVEINLTQRAGPDLWRALARPGKRLRVGDRLEIAGGLSAILAEKGEGGEVTLRFDRAGEALHQAIAEAGAPPLPPYIARRRAPDAEDRDDYQTIYAEEEGSVAAPTAGLHFTPALRGALQERGVGWTTVTLHVGAGTFLPVASDDVTSHQMHAEQIHISQDTADAINDTRERGGRVVAVGTTSLRSLESAVDAEGRVRARAGETDLFITPGYRFRAVDVLLTNFHLPRSTLYMLVCAFAGTEVMKRAYAHAVAAGYRFYSYGDACLLHRAEAPA